MFGDKRKPPTTIAAEIDRIIGLNIRRARDHVKLGQHEVSGLLGISTHLLARYEEGQERTPAVVLLELTRHLGCQLTDLFAGMPSLEVEEEFQGSRPSILPVNEAQPSPPSSSQPPNNAAGSAASEPVAVQGAVQPEALGGQSRPDAVAVARIIEVYSALESPNVRERLLDLLQALQ